MSADSSKMANDEVVANLKNFVKSLCSTAGPVTTVVDFGARMATLGWQLRKADLYIDMSN